jgi:hypothetical protein
VNLLASNIDSIRKNTETLIDSSIEAGSEVVSTFREVANWSFGNVSQFRYLGTTVTNENLIRERIKRRLNSDNACYHPVRTEPFVFSSAVKKRKNENPPPPPKEDSWYSVLLEVESTPGP